MRTLLSKMSITRQFSILAILGAALTLAGLGLTLKRSYELAFDAKRAEVRHIAEAAATMVQSFIQQERSGALSLVEAQKRAKDVLNSVRFDGNNYVICYTLDGINLVNPQKELIGTNRLNVTDTTGKRFIQSFVDVAKSGHPDFVDYHWPKNGSTKAEQKISYIIGVPEWQWLLGTGLYVDDVDAMLVAGAAHLAMIFVPLLLAFVLIVFLMRRAVAGLLASLASRMRRLAAGDLEAPIVGRERADEIGQMAEALVAFRQAALDKERLEGEAAEKARVVEAERAQNEAQKAAAAAEQARVVATIADGLDRLAKGKLDQKIETPFPAGYERLRVDFNTATDRLLSNMLNVARNTSAISNGTREIATASDDLSRRTEQQAASLQETAAALAQITQMVSKTSSGAQSTFELVLATKEQAEQSSEVVGRAIGAIKDIRQSSSQIAQIIGVIDEIAFQTNLLALNAGVEAARAGDSGRGFAVVASEVRALAQRCTEAAKEIKGLITASSGLVEQGVSLVDRTGQALSEINTSVTQITKVISEISDAAREQATGLDEINKAIAQMDKVTQQNAAMVEESTAATHSLAGETTDLVAVIQQFDLGGSRQQTAPIDLATRKKPVAPPTRPPLKRAVNASYVPRTGSSDGDDWTAF